MAVLLVGLEVALEPADLRVALEGQHVRGDAVEEPAVVRDHHGAAGEGQQRLLERAQRVHVEVVRGLVEQQQVAAASAAASRGAARLRSPPESAPTVALLVGALEVEARHVRARVHLPLADLDLVVAAGDLLPDGLGRVERVARLVHVGELHGVAEPQRAVVRLLLAGDHAEERGLAGAVGADHADDARRRQGEREVLDQELVAEALAQVVGLEHQVAQARARRGCGSARRRASRCRSSASSSS